MTEQIRVYFAGPLFTQAEWLWNLRLANELRGLGMNIVLPQAEADLMLKGKKPFDATSLFSSNTTEIDNADVVLAVLDQPDPDSGTCWECGYAYKSGRPIVGLRTDFRPAGDDSERPVNLMLARSCKGFVAVPPHKIDDLVYVAEQVATVIRNVFQAESTRDRSAANRSF